MPAGMTDTDSMISVREVPWHRHQNALVLDESPKTPKEAWEKAIGWEIVQVPVTYEFNGQKIEDPSIRLNLRSDTGDRLGKVTVDYVVFQPLEQLEFAAAITGHGGLWETIGSLHGGRQIYCCFRFPEWVVVGGDQTGLYGFITNHFGGWQSIKAKATAVRVVCQNTHAAALGDGLPTLAIPHYGAVHQKVEEARKVMGLTMNYGKQFKEFGDRLASSKMTERQLKKVLEQLYPTDVTASDRKRQNKEDIRNHIMWMFKEAPTCVEMANAPGTAWTALNAITEFADYGQKAEDEVMGDDAFFTRVLDDPKHIKERATELIGALV